PSPAAARESPPREAPRGRRGSRRPARSEAFGTAGAAARPSPRRRARAKRQRRGERSQLELEEDAVDELTVLADDLLHVADLPPAELARECDACLVRRPDAADERVEAAAPRLGDQVLAQGGRGAEAPTPAPHVGRERPGLREAGLRVVGRERDPADDEPLALGDPDRVRVVVRREPLALPLGVGAAQVAGGDAVLDA